MKIYILLCISMLELCAFGQTRSASSELDNVASCNVAYSGELHGLKDESNAIGIISKFEGFTWRDIATGALIMTTDNSFKPYLLTCYHLTEEVALSNLSNLSVWFFCRDDATTISRCYSVVGYKAYSESSDYLLLELEQDVSSDPFLTWLGWDRSGSVPSSGTCLHHPFGSNLKISTSTSIGYKSYRGNNSFWDAYWDSGITQKGSSGAPLLDQNNRIIGQVKGAYPEEVIDPCDRVNTLFGRFDLSWSRGTTNDSLLSVWLDPINTGQTTKNSSKRYNPSITGSSLLCNQEVYTLNDLAPNFTVEWCVENSTAEILYGQGTTSVTVGKCGDGKNKVIAKLELGGLTHFTVSKDITVGTPEIGPLEFGSGENYTGYWQNGVVNSIHIDNAFLGSYDRYEANVYTIDSNFNPSQLYRHFYFQGSTYNNIGYPIGWYLVKVRGINECGYSDWTESEVEVVDDWLLDIVYDVSTEVLEVYLMRSVSNDTQKYLNANSLTSDNYEIQIWNSSKMVKRFYGNDIKSQISLAGLPSGIFVVRVLKNGNVYYKKFVKR